jgi:hypothetical protein
MPPGAQLKASLQLESLQALNSISDFAPAQLHSSLHCFNRKNRFPLGGALVALLLTTVPR